MLQFSCNASHKRNWAAGVCVALALHWLEPAWVNWKIFRATSLPRQTEADRHNAYQAKVFDENAAFFASQSATPPAVVPKMRRVAQSCQLSETTTILDVATGTGALLPFYQEENASLSLVTGVDLSAGMLMYAREKYPEASFMQSDILDFTCAGKRFDRVVFNACFGNFWDPAAVLRNVAENFAAAEGLVILSHPLGRSWLAGLRAKDPSMVPHDYPAEKELRTLLAKIPLTLVSLEDEADYYCAVLKHTPL